MKDYLKRGVMSISFSFSLFQSNADCFRAMIIKQKRCTADDCNESCCLSGCQATKISRSMCTCVMDFNLRSEKKDQAALEGSWNEYKNALNYL